MHKTIALNSSITSLLLTYPLTFQNVVPRLTASTLPGDLLERHILEPHPQPTDSETVRVGTAICVSYVILTHPSLKATDPDVKVSNDGKCLK